MSPDTPEVDAELAQAQAQHKVAEATRDLSKVTLISWTGPTLCSLFIVCTETTAGRFLRAGVLANRKSFHDPSLHRDKRRP
jgi:hypothetical protein